MQKKAMYELTNPQKIIWNMENFYQDTPINNICTPAIIYEPINKTLLEKAINNIVKNNDNFRIRIALEDGIPKQYFCNYAPFTLEFLQVKNENELNALTEIEATQKFDIYNSCLFRFKIAIFKDNHFAIILTVHHLIADSWALGLVIKEILKEYHALTHETAFKNNVATSLCLEEASKNTVNSNNTSLQENNQDFNYNSETYSYLDYIFSEDEYKNSIKYQKDKAFWNEIFKTIPEKASIPSYNLTSTNVKAFSSKANRLSFSFDKKLTDSLNAYCKENKISMFNLLMSIYSIYISRVSGLEDFVIGTPILNRTNFKEKHTIGMFVNMVPVRVNTANNKSFSEFVNHIGSNLMGILRHQKYSYSQILNDIRFKVKSSQPTASLDNDNTLLNLKQTKANSEVSNLYNILISYQITKAFDKEYGSYKTDWVFSKHCSGDFNIHITDINDTGELKISYDYLIDKYTAKEVKALHQRIEYMLEQILGSSTLKINEIEIITKEEKNKQIFDFNNTHLNYPKNKTIVDLFESQVKKAPNQIAVVCNNIKLTYKELNEYANSLAYYLRNTVKIKPNELVSFMVERSVEIMICIIGIIKAGGAYVPIDPTYPEDRITYMLESSKTKILLTQQSLGKKIKFENKFFIDFPSPENENINRSQNLVYGKNIENLPHINKPSNLAYVIFTSGSTGKPKGVMLKHSNAINLKYAMQDFLGISHNIAISALATISFDMFVMESLVATLLGLKIVIANNDEQTNIKLFKELCIKNNVEILESTPSRMQSFMLNTEDSDFIKNAKYILVGGEPFTPSLLPKFREITTAKVYNMYGPTETTVWSSGKELKSSNEINIGKPLANTQIYILDKNLMPLPIGVCGEICISGDGVGNGYLNNALLTKNCFVPNPFVPGTTMYKTGDLGFYTDNGEIVCLGRKDNQVKIRGLRIELGEIENKISNLNYIDECAVVKKVDKNSREFLCAYFTSKEAVHKSEFIKALSSILPRYMVPNIYMQMDKMPYTATGKIDRKSLPEPHFSNIEKEIVLPRNENDIQLVKILKRIINIDSVSIEDSFFEIGGDSLSAINLCAEIQNKFNVQLFIKDILENPIIKDISDLIATKISSSFYDIKKVEKADFYPVSSAQKRIYFASEIARNSCLYNIPGGLIIDGKIDIKKLESCFKTLINRHETLRTFFEIQNNQVVQKVLDNYDFSLVVEKATNFKDLNNIFNNFLKPFNLNKAPLFRAKLICFSEYKYALLIDMHHIISDGLSLSVMANELCKLYNSDTLPEIRITYKDFASYENNLLSNPTDSLKDAENYWLNEFKTDIPLLNLPTNKQRPTSLSFEGKKVYTHINSGLTKKINEVAKSLEVTPYMFLLSCYYILLAKYTSSEDIVVGSPISGRNILDTNNLIGMFVNTLALRNTVNQDLCFKDFLLNIKENVLKAFKYQAYPFDELVNKLDIKRDSSRNPLFDTMFIYQSNGYKEINFEGANASYFIPDTGISKFDLSLEAVPDNDKINLTFEYATDLFDLDFIENMSKHYINILNNVIHNIDAKLFEIDLFSAEEKNKILYSFNNTASSYPKNETIINLFEQQVQKTPDNIALVFEDEKLTYKELNKKVNSLAYYLRNTQKLHNNDLVGIMVERSMEMIVGILATLKCGSAYFPIDPTYPADRIAYMLKNSNAKVLLTQKKLQDKIIFENKINIDLDNSSIYNLPAQNLEIINQPEDLSYVIFTSGSTGLPKGVMLKHKSLLNLAYYCNNYIDYLKEPSNMSIVSTTTISFDIFIFETIISLTRGLKLIIANENEQNTPVLLNNLIQKYDVKIIQATPSRMQIFLNNFKDMPSLKNLKYITLAGEQLPLSLAKDLHNIADVTIYNGYGPSETTVFSTLTKMDNEKITIGKPLYNTQIYILDNYKNPVPIGVSGEIYISGDGVGKGYLNRPDLTEKSFIPNPFVLGTTMYKTGDLGKYLTDGNIICLGRSDNQVKIRGLRIELGEIEEVLQTLPYIDTSTVIKTVDNNSHEYLCAYFTSSSAVNTTDLRQQLMKSLPKYMVPQYFVQMDKLPYTPNGKIDRKKLPAPEYRADKKEIVLPRNNTDSKLIDILKKLLNIDKISIDDDFYELGGDSLTAINLCVQIHKEFHIQLFAKDILENPIIQDISDYINKQNPTSILELKHVSNADYYEVSSAQKRIYFASEVAGNGNILYNIPIGIIFDSFVSFEKLEECINVLIHRHEALRTYFEIEDNRVVQKVIAHLDYKLDVIENIDYENLDNIYKDFVKPFDLSKAPLFRAQYVKFTNNKSGLFIDMHHIISDGASMGILANELNKLYNNKPLENLEFSYKDIAYFENNRLTSGGFKSAEDFWLKEFDSGIPELNLPTSYPRPAVQNFEGDKVYLKIPLSYTNKIYSLSKSLGVTPYVILLSTYYILLSKYTSNTDIIIGSPVVGRDIPESSNLIGVFVNTLALKKNIDMNLSFKDFVLSVKNTVLKAYQYQTYPFDELVNKLNIKRDPSKNPLFDTMFIYQNNKIPNLDFDGVKSTFNIPNINISKFDLSIEAVPIDGEIDLSFEYCINLFEKSFIEALSKHYYNILQVVIENIDSKICDIDMLSKYERHRILYDFNYTTVDYDKNKTIINLFEEQVEKTPDNIALVFEDNELSFRELNEKANSLAYFLRNEKHIKPNDIVGIMVNRSLEMIVAILAVLKSGGAYIPIDPSFPTDRVKYMLNNSNAKLLLIQEKIASKISFENSVCIDLNKKIYSLPKDNLQNTNCPDDLAYIIYTSGSTGAPKGVMIQHQVLSNFTTYCNDTVEYLKSEECSSIVSITTISFDIFFYETIISLQKGLKVVIANEAAQHTIDLLNDLIKKHNITIMQSTPSRMQIFLNNIDAIPNLKDIKYVILAGEQLPLSLLKDLHNLADIVVYNGYGPSETYYSTLTKMTNDIITIGKPIYNSQMYILDKNMQPVPIGIVGEIYISGDCVGKGYLNNPELTKKSFLPNYFVTDNILYKTGDLGKYTETGDIICLGRIDNQVKIRGLRIELDEIESFVLKYSHISKAVVIKQQIHNREFISCYYVADKKININNLRNYLSKKIPRYMVPSYFIPLEDLPYTPNGKIDRKALPLSNEILSISKSIYVAPTTKLQKQLVKIWENILNTSPIGIYDNFFELGGDSLLGMSLNVELQKISKKITYSDIFRFPTIIELEKEINSNDSTNFFNKIENLSDNFVDILKGCTKKGVQKKYIPQNILLTGATGYLGIHVLEEFIKRKSGNVYCIVRDSNGMSANARLHQKLNYYFGNKYDSLLDKRIFAVTGDISEPGFGLNQEDLLSLVNKIDLVINSAANVSHYGNYADFYKANVTSVKHIIDFCKSFNKKLYHISTIGVAGKKLDSQFLSYSSKKKRKLKKVSIGFNESNLYIGQILDNVYSDTKFVAEVSVLNAISSGLDAYILRMGYLMPRYRDGVFQENIEDNDFINKIASFVKIEMVPKYLLEQSIELTPVDCAAKAIYSLITHPSKTNRIFHLYNHNYISANKLLKVAHKQSLNIQALSEDEFKEKINKLLENEASKNLLERLFEDFDENLHLDYTNDMIIDSSFTIKYLRKNLFWWPHISKRYLRLVLKLIKKEL